MSSIAIYVEGGGEGRDGRAALRRGMDAFLDEQKQMARSRGWRWKLVCLGSRGDTFRAFRNATKREEANVVVLLVDAEGPVRGGQIAHLSDQDGWILDFANEETVHLMVQAMEAWIVADDVALNDYYGQGFRVNALPRAANLESVRSGTWREASTLPLGGQPKGTYHKIRHASALLARIRPDRVRERCEGCRRLLDFLTLTLA